MSIIQTGVQILDARGRAAALVLALAATGASAQHDRFRAFDLPIPNGAEYSTAGGVGVIAADDVWAVGRWQGRVSGKAELYTLTLHYDGREWSIVDSPSPGRGYAGGTQCYLYDVDASGPDDVWAVGVHMHPTQAGTETLVLHWDGSAWSTVDSPTAPPGGTGSLFNAVEARGPDDVWAVGSWASSGSEGFAAHHDGSGWTTYETPHSGTIGHHELRGLSVLPSGEVWAAGGAGGWTGHGAGYVVRFDGSRWHHVPTPSFGITDDFRSIHAFATDDVWACGVYDDADNQAHPYLLHWDGSSWTRHDSPGFATGLAATDDGRLYGLSGGLLVRWDGQQWVRDATLSGASFPVLFDLEAADDGSLFASGANGVASQRTPLAGLRLATDRLRLQASPDEAQAGDMVELRLSYGLAGSRSLFALTAIDGVPRFDPFLRLDFDADNLATATGLVPPGLSGLELEFAGIGRNLDLRIVASPPATLRVH